MNHDDHIRDELFDFNCESCRKEFVAQIQHPSTQNEMLDLLAESLPDRSLKIGEYDGTSTS